MEFSVVELLQLGPDYAALAVALILLGRLSRVEKRLAAYARAIRNNRRRIERLEQEQQQWKQHSANVAANAGCYGSRQARQGSH